jgi:hypothetical protein
MPTSRDYTGLVRTPSSMAWLIRNRSLIKGRIDRLSKMRAEIPDKIKEPQQELDVLDAVIPLQEEPVDPKVIKGRRPKRQALAKHGELTTTGGVGSAGIGASQQGLQLFRGDFRQFPESRSQGVDEPARHLFGLEMLAPAKHLAYDRGHHGERGRPLQVEGRVSSKGVVQRGELALRADLKMQEALVGDARARDDVV